MKKLAYVFLSMLLIVGLNTLNAQEEAEVEEVSALTNQAQVQKAESLAEASQSLSAEEVAQAQENVNSTQSEYDAAKSALEADPENVELQEAFSLAEENLNNATSALADASGTTVESIDAMRLEGMGWGEIAHELGIHPSVLGLGHSKKTASQERVRSTKSFKTNTPSVNNGNGKSQGLKGKSSSSSSNAKGNGSNGKGNAGGNGKGNAGGNGKGNSGGNGKGK